MKKIMTLFAALLFSLAACTGTSAQVGKNSGKAEQETGTEKEGRVNERLND